MFGWFKRRPEPTAPRRKSRSSRQPSLPLGDTTPAPLPEVVAEGNSQSDWSEWESSMMGLDSQMGELTPGSSVYERDSPSRYTKPAPLHEEDDDTFRRVGKNHEV